MTVLASVIVRDVYASLPAAGVPGRIFYATDRGLSYRDNGTSWDSYSLPPRSIASVSSSGTVTAAVAGETVERVTTSSSTITRTLPAATGSGAVIVSKKVDSGAGTVVNTAAGSDTIDGVATYTLVNQYQYVRLLDAASGVWDIDGGN